VSNGEDVPNPKEILINKNKCLSPTNMAGISSEKVLQCLELSVKETSPLKMASSGDIRKIKDLNIKAGDL
jgi:hypothetical protein